MARVLSRESAHDSERSALPPAGTVLDQRFELIELIGVGGMGAVYRARDRRDGRILALKLLTADEATGARRFRREYRAAARLAHPGVVAVRSFHPGPRPFFTMELVPGSTLGNWVGAQQDARIDDSGRDTRIRGALRQILEALDYIHGCGLVHRDLKPENILVTPDGVVKIMDFGVVRGGASSSGITRGRIVGTLSYMAPEQLEGREVDARADLYSVGAVLYELLTGEPPFDQNQFGSLARAILTEPPPPPRSLNPRADPILADMATTLLSKRPWQRFASARDALAVLEGKSDVKERRPPLLVPQFAGREAELATVRALLFDEPPEPGAAVLVSGRKGHGKSRFLIEVGAVATVRGRRVLIAPPHPPAAKPLTSLTWLFRELAIDDRGEGPPDFGRSQRALFSTLASLPSGLVVILDDLERYDPLSIDLVHSLLRELAAPTPGRSPHGLSLIASFTPDLPRGHPLARAVDLVIALGIGAHIELAALGHDESAAMVRSMLGEARVPRALAEWAQREAEGVPSLIEASVRHLVESDLLLVQRGGLTLNWRSLGRPPRDALELEDFAQLPSCVHVFTRLENELDGLPERLLQLMRLACLVGQELDFDLLLAASGESEDSLIDAIQDLLARRILVEVYERPDHFRFVQDRARLALAARLEPEVARRAHLDIARALELVAERDAVALAHHYDAAGELERASRYLLPAAQRLSSEMAHPEAARAWERYLELLPPPAPERARAEVALAREYLALGRPREGKTVLEAALTHAARETRVEALRWLAEIEQRLGNGAAATGRAYEILTLANEGGELRDRTRAQVALAIVLLDQAYYGEAERHLSEAERRCRETAGSAELAEILRLRGLALAGLGRLHEAMTSTQEALTLARHARARASEQLTLHDLGFLHFLLGNLDRAIGCLEPSLSLAEELGIAERVSAAQSHLAEVYIAAGDDAGAESLLSRRLRVGAADRADALESRAAGRALLLRAGLRRLRLDLNGARIDAQRARELLGRTVHAPSLIALALESSRIELLARHRVAARAEARHALALARAQRLRWFEAEALTQLAATLHGAKALAQARRAVALATDLGASLLRLWALSRLVALEPAGAARDQATEEARRIAMTLARKLGHRGRLFLRHCPDPVATRALDNPRGHATITSSNP